MDIIIDIMKKVLKDTGGSIYIVGGYIRDKLMETNEVSKDLDMVYEGNIEVFVEELEKKGYRVFCLKENMGIYRVLIDGSIVDIIRIKGNNIEEDLRERDFTINAIALRLIDNKIIDPFEGRDYIKAKIIHEVNENSIRNDKVRILRALRFSLKYEMNFSDECKKNIRENSCYIKNYPKERIFNEFIRLVEEDNEGIAFELLEGYGVLKELVPYIDDLKKIGKCKYHIEDAFTHMNLVYKTYKQLSKEGFGLLDIDIRILNENIGIIPIKTYIAFAAFFHDIGKSSCYKNINGKISFIGHDIVGAKIISRLCEDLGFPKKAEEFITTLVEAHMYPLGIYKSKAKNHKKSFYKFFSKYNKYIPYILLISYCDISATKELYDPDDEKGILKDHINKLIREYKIYKTIKENRLLNGIEIMKLTGTEGKMVKELLEEIDRNVYYGKITNKEDAIKFLKK